MARTMVLKTNVEPSVVLIENSPRSFVEVPILVPLILIETPDNDPLSEATFPVIRCVCAERLKKNSTNMTGRSKNLIMAS